MKTLHLPKMLTMPLLFIGLLGWDALGAATDARDTRYFRIDAHNKIVGPAAHLPPALALQLVSVTTDQPQVWPDEPVRLRIAMPGRGGQAVAIKWFKRDATPREVSGIALDDEGLAVVVLADGKTDRLQLGEYRAEVKTADGKAQGTATFSVVEGALGAVSLAFAFDRVTSAEQLDTVKAGWFLGNAAGAGTRWGNGLSFKNELRVDNVPYDGDAEIIPRCMLSGCNGVVAGPQQHLQVRKGLLAGTINIGGHSGPFQIEIVTPAGSLRHQFEGSGHVEREMLPIAKGVRFGHRLGLAPYEKTVQVPGRQLFVDHPAEIATDALEVASPIATDGKVVFKAQVALANVAAMVWQPQPDGSYVAKDAPIAHSLRAGELATIAVTVPMALVAVGGTETVAGKEVFREGYVLALVPGGLQPKLTVPKDAAPNASVKVEVALNDAAGHPIAGSGILEAYDIRVAARDPAGQLASAIGDSVRTAGRHLEQWVDPVELERQRKEEERLRKEEEKQQREQERRDRMEQRKADAAEKKAEAKGMSYGRLGVGSGGGGAGYAVGYGSVAAPKMMVQGGSPGRPSLAARQHSHGPADGDAGEEGEDVRQGEVKIAFVAVVRTGADGKATVEVPTPPQTGRLAFRFTPVRGMDWATAEAQTDLVRVASVELKAPRSLVAGGTLDLQVVTQNKSTQALTLRVSGAGLEQPVVRHVASGKQTHVLAWPAQAGELLATLVDATGKVVDRRGVTITDVAQQKVTWSRLQVGGPQAIVVQPGEKVVAYANPGGLLHGIVSNMVTTMESWFPHAEALSAQVAVRATLLAAIQRGILADDGYSKGLQGGLEQAVLKRQREWYDPATKMMRPYAGLAANALWSGWVAANLQQARRVIKQVPALRGRMAASAVAIDQLAKDLTDGLAARNEKSEKFGFSAARDGEEVVEIEVEGGGRFEVVTDDVVQQFAIDKLLPALADCDDNCAQDSKQLGKALDHFRLVRAFSRVGKLQWMVGQAKAAWAAGAKGQAAFDKLFGVVARGFVLTQEPGMLQGPALLGGVYSQPMALPRFLELLLVMGLRPAEAGTLAMTVEGKARKVSYGQVVEVSSVAQLVLPRGAMARIDRAGQVDLRSSADKPFAKASIDKADLAVGEQGVLTVELAPEADPMAYYALVAVPATVAIRQTEDALSDYKGQLIYGQQSMGSSKMQVIAVPFRGLRTLKIWIEGFLPGQAPGLVAVRHVHDADKFCSVAIPAVRVRAVQAAGGGAVQPVASR